MLSWPNLPDQLNKKDYMHDVHVAIMTYAGDLFSWYAGSMDADVYFCPERHGTYLGSFYLNDAPAVNTSIITIAITITETQARLASSYSSWGRPSCASPGRTSRCHWLRVRTTIPPAPSAWPVE
ncbi:MAG: hypothetical protein WCC06_02835 [Candidatus Aminicenantales bacterium]